MDDYLSEGSMNAKVFAFLRLQEYNENMNNPEAKKNSAYNAQEWDMSGVPFTGSEQRSEKERISQYLRYAPELLSGNSEIFGNNGRMNNFTNVILYGTNNEILNNIKQLDDGKYFENYGVDHANRGFTGYGQVSGALDYFDDKYGDLIDDNNLKGLVKTSLAFWPMGNLGSFGVHEFAKSAKIDRETAKLINMLIDRNSMELVQARFVYNNEEAGKKLLQVNKDFLTEMSDGIASGYEEKIAECTCNIQKIIMDCAKNGATIAKERKAKRMNRNA